MSRFDTDIVERLEWDKRYTRGHVPVTLADAAKEIKRLRAGLQEIAENAIDAESAAFAREILRSGA